MDKSSQVGSQEFEAQLEALGGLLEQVLSLLCVVEGIKETLEAAGFLEPGSFPAFYKAWKSQQASKAGLLHWHQSKKEPYGVSLTPRT